MRYTGNTVNFFLQSAPFLMAVSSFAIYLASDPDNHVLDAEKAFVSISYFNLMKTPLMWLPFFMNEIIQAWVSANRINDYLGAAEINPADINREEAAEAGGEGKPSLEVSSEGSFCWDADLPPTISLSELKVGKGQLIGIIGQVRTLYIQST